MRISDKLEGDDRAGSPVHAPQIKNAARDWTALFPVRVRQGTDAIQEP